MKRIITSLWLAFFLLSSGVAYASGPTMQVYLNPSDFGRVEPGTTHTAHISIQESSGDKPLTGVSLYWSGNGSQWVTASEQYIGKIPASSMKEVTLYLKLPKDASAGAYTCAIIIKAEECSETVVLAFQVPIILALSQYNINASTTPEQEESFEVTLTNTCQTASIRDIRVSAGEGIRNWLVLPSSISSLGKGASTTKEIKVRVPEEALQPIGKYSGTIHIEYRGGAVDIRTAIKILPPNTWFQETHGEIDSLPHNIRVYQITEPYMENEDCTATKEALHSIVSLIREDPSHFYDVTEPFIKASVEGYILASDLVVAFEAWLARTEPLSKTEEILEGLSSSQENTGEILEIEVRPAFRKQMVVIYGQLESIKGTWEEKLHKEQSGVHAHAQTEKEEGREMWEKARNEPLLIPSCKYYQLAKEYFENAAVLYRQIGWGAEAQECDSEAANCEREIVKTNKEIDQVLALAQSEEAAGTEDYEKGNDEYCLVSSRDFFSSAKPHFVKAAEQYWKLGTLEYNDKAKHCEQMRKESELKEEGRNDDIAKTRQHGLDKQRAGEDAITQGDKAWFAPICLSHYNTARQYLQQAYAEFSLLGGSEGRAKAEGVEILIRKVDGQVTRKKIELGVYILLPLIVIGLMGKRYQSMRSIRREIEVEKKLFREL